MYHVLLTIRTSLFLPSKSCTIEPGSVIERYAVTYMVVALVRTCCLLVKGHATRPFLTSPETLHMTVAGVTL